jgi:zinc protease
MERIGGYGGKSDILAQSATYGGSADYYKVVQKMIKAATPADIKKAYSDWLSDGEYVLEILPYSKFSTAANTLNRAEQPKMSEMPAVKFPQVNSFTLSNGLKIFLVQRQAVPIVNMLLMVNAGYAADRAELPGLASMAGKMLAEGTKTKSSLQISNTMADLGANIYSYSDLDDSYLALDALKNNFDPSLDLFSDILLNPSFPGKDFERVQKEQILTIKQEEVQPVTMGLRLLPRLLYGNGHAYSNPFTGTGTEDAVKKMTRDDLVKFHQTWFTPSNASLIVVGDISASEIKEKLENKLITWKAKAAPVKNISEVALPEKPAVYIIDKPGALQSIIFAAEISPSAKDPAYEAIKMMNRIIGGEFTSRINMNLRENKHWSYGSFSINLDAKGPSFFTAFAPVQTDKTKESVQELQKELKQFVSDKPATDAEFKKVQRNAVLQLPGIWETNSAIIYTLKDAITYERDAQYLNNYPGMLQNLSLSEIQKSAANVIKPEKLTWVIVGDRSKIEKGIQELNIGTIKYLDVEGKDVN